MSYGRWDFAFDKKLVEITELIEIKIMKTALVKNLKWHTTLIDKTTWEFFQVGNTKGKQNYNTEFSSFNYSLAK